MRELRPRVAHQRTSMAFLVLVIVLLANSPAKTQERIDELSRQFDAEKDPCEERNSFPNWAKPNLNFCGRRPGLKTMNRHLLS